MKYFTPDLLERYGSLDDQIADEANDEFELACTKYIFVLRQVLYDKLPPKLPELLDKFPLHDAKTFLLGESSGSFYLGLIPKGPQKELLILRYKLASKGVYQIPHPNINDHLCPDLEWLYDEVSDVEEKQGEFTHSILFTKGFELVITFSDFDYFLIDSLGKASKILEVKPESDNEKDGVKTAYTAVMQKQGDWWVGWIEEIPGVNGQGRTRQAFLESLKSALKEALEMNRNEALAAAQGDFEEVSIEV